MTTSLARQLDNLRTATSAQLGVERSYTSLLFDSKDARALTADSALELGQAGISQLKKLDRTIEKDDQSLFDDTAINVQRILMSKEENSKLDTKIERIIMQLAPYLLHFSAKQVLEWLIFRFQIHAFNARKLFITFLPYHNTNIFARILSILDLKGLEYDWVRLYAKTEQPIPFEKLVTKCFSRNHSLLAMISDHIECVIENFPPEHIESRMPFLFNFYASLCIHVIERSGMSDEKLSRMLPFIAKGLVSKMRSLRLCCLMIISQLCVSTDLVPTKLNALVKLILLKFDQSSAKESIDTFVVICQRQNILSLPSVKVAIKFMKRINKFKMIKYINSLYSITDMRPFMSVCFRSYIPLLNTAENEKCAEISSLLINCIDLTAFDHDLATSIISQICYLISTSDNSARIPDLFWNYTRSIILRFPCAFNSACSEWQLRDATTINFITEKCGLEGHEVTVQENESIEQKKRRKRRRSTRKSISDESEMIDEPLKIKKKRPEEVKEEQLNAVREPQKVVFKGDPIEKLVNTLKAQNWELSAAGLEKLTSKDYVKQRSAEDFQEFIVSMIKVALNEGAQMKAPIRSSLTELPMTSDFAISLLSDTAFKKSIRKTRRTTNRKEDDEAVENEDGVEQRRIFVLELLKSNENIERSGKLLSASFAELVRSLRYESTSNTYSQRLIIGLITQMIRNPHGYKVVADDLQLSSVADIVRQTSDHAVLRDCLQLLIAAVPISPSTLFSHLMSVFTFMGGGLLRKDNALTLSIIEEALSVLFSVVIDEKNERFGEHLVEISRLFALSAIDIPAHRRNRILSVVARSATANCLWAVIAVLFAHYCLNWQKCDSSRERSTVELYEEMAITMTSVYGFEQQLGCVIDLVNYVIELGGDEDTNTNITVQHKSIQSNNIFDRKKHSIQKLRHHRFAMLGVVARLLSSDELLAELGSINIKTAYEQLLAIAKRLLFCSMEFDLFVTEETGKAEKNQRTHQNDTTSHQYDQSVKYWFAISSRAEIIIEKFQNLLPISVCGELVSDILQQSDVSARLRDRALQFLNSKLVQVGSFGRIEGLKSGVIDKLITIINRWLQPAESGHDASMCQNAAFTLKLIARNLPPATNSLQLSETLELSSKLLNDWSSQSEVVIGNLLILFGELMRFNRARNALLYTNTGIAVCIDIVNRWNDSKNSAKSITQSDNQLASPMRMTRKRRGQQSISGYIGTDTLLVCSLICLQRIVENYAGFITSQLVQLFITLARLCCTYHEPSPKTCEQINRENIEATIAKQSNASLRVENICRAVSKMELRIILEPFEEACKQLMSEPKAVSMLFKLLAIFNELKDRSILLKNIEQLHKIYLIGFELRSRNPRFKDFKQTCESELAVIDSFLEVVDCLSENEFQPIARSIYDWQKPALNPGSSSEIQLRLITVFAFLNRFYESYKDLALPHFSNFLEIAPEILNRCGKHCEDAASVILIGGKGSIEAQSAHFLLVLTIDFITNCARHSQYFTLERCRPLLESLFSELENISVEGHEKRCVPHLADCFYHIIDSRNELLDEIINKIMLRTHDRSRKIRYRTLLLLEKLFDRMGEAIAPVLPSIVPVLSEILEDDDERVEMQCDKVIGTLRKKFGETADAYF